jgi:hypothetical protein
MAAITFPNNLVQPGHSFGARAGAAITSKHACVISGASEGLVIQSSAANQVARGFIQLDGTAAASGDQVEVYYSGIVWVESAAAITIDTFVGTEAAGRVATAAVNTYHVGIALKAASGAGELIPMLIVFGERGAA